MKVKNSISYFHKKNMILNFSRYWDKIFKGQTEFNRFGIITIALLIVGCLGGVTVGLGAINNIFHLILIVSSSMASLVAILAVFPVIWILNISLLAALIDILLLISYLL